MNYGDPVLTSHFLSTFPGAANDSVSPWLVFHYLFWHFRPKSKPDSGGN
jgi:hypothetical protein